MTRTWPRRSVARLLALGMVAIALIVVPTSAAVAGPNEDDFVARTNAARAAAGLPALSVAADLIANATAHSQRMADLNSLHHNPDLRTQITNWVSLGENVGYGGSVESIHNALMNSPSHRANILNSTFTQIGVGTQVSNGRIWVTQVFRKPATSSGYPVMGAIAAAAGAHPYIGAPTSAEFDVPGGRAQTFQAGLIVWSPTTGARVVRGDIQRRYLDMGGAHSVLRLPTTSEVALPGGAANRFLGGQLFWTPEAGTKMIHGAIAGRYDHLGGGFSGLGLPISDELAAGAGRSTHFQRARILWSSTTGAWEVYGAVLGRYVATGEADGVLGLPLSAEFGVPGGRAQRFERGVLLWSPGTGAQELYGAILARWTAVGGTAGALGFPVKGEYAVPGGRATDFQRGRMYWSPDTGAQEVFGAILGHYLTTGGPGGSLGLPVTGEYSVPGGRRSDFQLGSITWNATTGATVVTAF